MHCCFFSQERVTSILPDNSKCFFWKLCFKRLSKLKISSDFPFLFFSVFFLVIKAAIVSKNTLVYVSIASQKLLSIITTCRKLPWLYRYQNKVLIFVIMKEKLLCPSACQYFKAHLKQSSRCSSFSQSVKRVMMNCRYCPQIPAPPPKTNLSD